MRRIDCTQESLLRTKFGLVLWRTNQRLFQITILNDMYIDTVYICWYTFKKSKLFFGESYRMLYDLLHNYNQRLKSNGLIFWFCGCFHSKLKADQLFDCNYWWIRQRSGYFPSHFLWDKQLWPKWNIPTVTVEQARPRSDCFVVCCWLITECRYTSLHHEKQHWRFFHN